MEARNITTIRLRPDTAQNIIDIANYLGTIIDPSFEASEERFEKQKSRVQMNPPSSRSNTYETQQKKTPFDVTHYFKAGNKLTEDKNNNTKIS